jgi:hypothetical protein
VLSTIRLCSYSVKILKQSTEEHRGRELKVETVHAVGQAKTSGRRRLAGRLDSVHGRRSSRPHAAATEHNRLGMLLLLLLLLLNASARWLAERRVDERRSSLAPEPKQRREDPGRGRAGEGVRARSSRGRRRRGKGGAGPRSWFFPTLSKESREKTEKRSSIRSVGLPELDLDVRLGARSREFCVVRFYKKMLL